MTDAANRTNTGPLVNNGLPRKRGRKSAEEQAAYERQVREAYAFYTEGHSLAAVAHRFGWGHEDSVRNAFRLRGFEIRPATETFAMRWRRLPELARSMTPREIAEVLQTTPETVRNRLRQLGIKAKRPPLTHGPAGYNRGCRCDVCVEAQRERNRRYSKAIKGRPPPTHGVSGYINYACRCEVCRAAGSEWNRRSRERRLQREAAS